MDEREFNRLLKIFPIVRSRTFCLAEEGSSSGNWYPTETKLQIREIQNDGKIDDFWQKLKLAAETKVGSDKAEQFLMAFRAAHETLVYKELSLDAAQSFLTSAGK